MKKSVLIVGAGHGLSSSLARLCAENNMSVALVARNIKKTREFSKRHKCNPT